MNSHHHMMVAYLQLFFFCEVILHLEEVSQLSNALAVDEACNVRRSATVMRKRETCKHRSMYITNTNEEKQSTHTKEMRLAICKNWAAYNRLNTSSLDNPFTKLL